MIDTFKILPHVGALTCAYALAFPIGWNRERESRSAGLRTFPLVAVATCGFIQAAEGLNPGDPASASRIIQGLTTGIGFIGGGAIMQQGVEVHGTATAAALWATGAIGVAVGLGAYDVAVVIAVFTAATLQFLKPLKEKAKGSSTEP